MRFGCVTYHAGQCRCYVALPAEVDLATQHGKVRPDSPAFAHPHHDRVLINHQVIGHRIDHAHVGRLAAERSQSGGDFRTTELDAGDRRAVGADHLIVVRTPRQHAESGDYANRLAVLEAFGVERNRLARQDAHRGRLQADAVDVDLVDDVHRKPIDGGYAVVVGVHDGLARGDADHSAAGERHRPLERAVLEPHRGPLGDHFGEAVGVSGFHAEIVELGPHRKGDGRSLIAEYQHLDRLIVPSLG